LELYERNYHDLDSQCTYHVKQHDDRLSVKRTKLLHSIIIPAAGSNCDVEFEVDRCDVWDTTLSDCLLDRRQCRKLSFCSSTTRLLPSDSFRYYYLYRKLCNFCRRVWAYICYTLFFCFSSLFLF